MLLETRWCVRVHSIHRHVLLEWMKNGLFTQLNNKWQSGRVVKPYLPFPSLFWSGRGCKKNDNLMIKCQVSDISWDCKLLKWSFIEPSIALRFAEKQFKIIWHWGIRNICYHVKTSGAFFWTFSSNWLIVRYMEPDFILIRLGALCGHQQSM